MKILPVLKKIDWILVLSILPLLVAGLITMKSLSPAEDVGDYFFTRQLIWILLGLSAFFWLSVTDLKWLRSSAVLVALYLFVNLALLALIVASREVRGASSWFELGLFSLEPVEPLKVVLILILAKYFSRRHIEIANVRHIVVSGFYAFLPAGLVFLQPDLGSALVIIALWLAMILASGVSKKHFFILLMLAVLAAAFLWFFAMEPYQRARIYSFINPYLDPKGSGYHTIQSTIAVGAGGLWGRGIGFGSQSRLEFLPEHETDFIFAAYVEEWGLVGALLLMLFFAVIIWRISRVGARVGGNFERLYAVGLGALLISQFFIHVGMNVGLLPITGLPLPFMSYGGSSLITSFAALGILISFKIWTSFLTGASGDDEKEGILT